MDNDPSYKLRTNWWYTLLSCNYNDSTIADFNLRGPLVCVPVFTKQRTIIRLVRYAT